MVCSATVNATRTAAATSPIFIRCMSFAPCALGREKPERGPTLGNDSGEVGGPKAPNYLEVPTASQGSDVLVVLSQDAAVLAVDSGLPTVATRRQRMVGFDRLD